jgi:maleylacetate reductase
MLNGAVMDKLQYLPQDAVLWGEGILASNLSNLDSFGIRRPIILSVEQLNEMRRRFIAPHLSGDVDVFLDLPPHAPDVAIRNGLSAVIHARAESIIAHGGGSVIDAAKAISHLHFKERGHYLPIVALPTTLSGSEFSHYFGITETGQSQKFKRSYAVQETVPKLVFLDPILLLDTPRALLLSSAIKAIDHAVEGMRHVSESHPHAIMAARGVRQFFKILERWPGQLEIAEVVGRTHLGLNDVQELQLASWQCYFSPASVIYGLSHRIGHVLGGTYGVPHSATSCITLAPVIRVCAPFYKGRLAVFSDDVSKEHSGERLADRIVTLVAGLGLPDRIRSYGVQQKQLGEVSALLLTKYPTEVADLGQDAEVKLDGLLASLW